MYNEAPIVDLINRRFDDLNHLVREMKMDFQKEVQKIEDVLEKKNLRIESLEQSRDKLNWTFALISATASGLAVVAVKALGFLL